ncbi:HAD family hydrolase [Psychrobacter sp. I-STPA6b]|uniref:HAD family hydrolase n=1 Tax=Psychrobacter sp. I-STPA6b TaxID=2585718 RepID=UPI001D0C0CBE|nr:HAD-IA family hydrolase [Psychrobacter sp. I-STPA6b]
MIKTSTEQTHDLSQKSLIIFDWDGTLMDSIGLIVKSMHIAGEANGFSSSDEAIKDIIGLSLIKGIEILYPQANSEEHQKIVQSYADYYIANSASSPFFTGIEDMLAQLKAQGKQLAVATGKKRVGLQRVLDDSGSEHYFVMTRCADESGSKPDPQMLKDILATTGHEVSDAVFIGDSVHDLQMANALGMTAIAVNYGAGQAQVLTQEHPTYQVDTPEQLAQLLLQPSQS